MHSAEKSSPYEPRSFSPETAATLAAPAVMAHENEAAAIMALDAHQRTADQVESIAQTWQRDPRYIGRVGRFVLRHQGKDALREQDAQTLESAGAYSVEGIRERGHRPHAVSHLEATVEMHTFDKQHSLRRVRNSLSRFDEAQAITLDGLLDEAENFPLFIKKQKPAEQSWAAWLSDPKGANNDQLMNVLEWQANTLEDMNNSPAGEQERQHIREAYEASLKDAVNRGALPAKALENIAKIQDVDIQFMAPLELAIERTHAYHLEHKTGSYVALPIKGKPRNAYHEINHAVLGNFYYDTEDPDFKPSKVRGDTWLNEALTVHAERVLQGVDTEEIFTDGDPDDRQYFMERKLLEAIIESSGGAVTGADFLNAYVEGGDAIPALQAKITEAHSGFDILGVVAEHIKHSNEDLGDMREPENQAKAQTRSNMIMMTTAIILTSNTRTEAPVNATIE